ncbi:hypothetical protein [Rhodococcus sp. Q]|nr:hypothetical protein [Rhodococcus sp. Q]
MSVPAAPLGGDGLVLADVDVSIGPTWSRRIQPGKTVTHLTINAP